MKQILIIFIFCFSSAAGMFRTDGPMDQVASECFEPRDSALALRSWERTDTVEIDYEDSNPVPPKKVKPARVRKDYAAQWKAWAACAKKYDIVMLSIKGYCVFANKNLMKGTCVTKDMKALHYAQDAVTSNAQELRALLAANYKIHLMPFDEDIVPIMAGLLERIEHDTQLQEAMSYFKVRVYTDAIRHDSDGTYFPIVVMYAHASKDAAQYVLDAVYALFADKKGLDITPRYNQKITSLIYYAQGDGDLKKDQFADYYEPDCIHYRADFEGHMKNYYLKNPAGNV